MSNAPEVTELLRLSRQGTLSARDRVFEILQSDLKRLAARLLRDGFRRSTMMQTTMLVNSAVERLLERGALDAENRRHLFSLLARAMHDVLVEEARAQGAIKRGGGQRPGVLEHDPASPESPKAEARLATAEELEALRRALDTLNEIEPDSAEAIWLSHYCGRSIRDIAEITGATVACVRGHLDYGRAWLRDRLTTSVDDAA